MSKEVRMVTEKIRVFLVDDHTLLRNALTMLLEGQKNIEVVGEAANASEAVEGVCKEKPDVVLMDISLPDFDGIEATVNIVALPLQELSP